MPGGIGANGNPGMVQAAQQNAYSIAYIGVSFAHEVAKAGLGTAAIENRAGHFLLPTHATVASAAHVMVNKTPRDERVSLVFAPGAQSYPIINYEYAIVSKQQRDPATAAAVRTFLNWAISARGGNAPHFLNQVGFVALPAPIVKLSLAQVGAIQ